MESPWKPVGECKVLPSSSTNSGDIEFMMFKDLPESPNSKNVLPSNRLTEREYWSAKSFPKIKGVVIPLTT